MPLESLQRGSRACTIHALKSPIAITVAIPVLFRRVVVHMRQVGIVLGIHGDVGGLLAFDSGADLSIIHIEKHGQW